jgi:hypothetical protein
MGVLQLFSMRVTILEALGRVVLVPVGGYLPLIAAVQAVELGLIMSVAVGHSSRSG